MAAYIGREVRGVGWKLTAMELISIVVLNLSTDLFICFLLSENKYGLLSAYFIKFYAIKSSTIHSKLFFLHRNAF